MNLYDFFFGPRVDAPARAPADKVGLGVRLVAKIAEDERKRNMSDAMFSLNGSVMFDTPEICPADGGQAPGIDPVAVNPPCAESSGGKPSGEGAQATHSNGMRYSVASRGVHAGRQSLDMRLEDFGKRYASNVPQSRLPDTNAPVLSFAARLIELVKSKCGGRAAFAYKRAGINRKVYSKIVSDARRAVSKRTAMQFAIGLQLTRPEADMLLKSAGYAFSDTIAEDAAFCYCIDQGIWNLRDLNALLGACGCQTVEIPANY